MRDITTLEAEIAAAEAQVPHLRDGCSKRIIWAGAPATQSRFSVVFIHGFSASAEEIRPVPDLVAQGLKANLYFTRLTGHGQDGTAMGRASLSAWQEDVAETLEIAQTIGQRVILIGCSTGCTLATLALADGARAHAMIHVSPNFGLTFRLAQTLLDLPGAPVWSDLIAGSERRFPARNAAHAAFWTRRYPTRAVHVMADAVRAVRQADLARITTPALFCYNEGDRVVSPRETRKAMARWGAPAASYRFRQTADDDQMGHIMAGDVFSPGQTQALVARISAWLATLPDD